MNEKFLQPYDASQAEPTVRELWESSGFTNPDVCESAGLIDPQADPFSIVLPPPNVTGILHIGHAAMISIEDIMVRYNRMLGKKTVWIPGTDHAAIATQSKVEKILAKEKIRRHDLGREAFLEKVNTYAQDAQSTILNQVRSMGASVDWTRLAFTLDDEREKAVHTAFIRMHKDGLIFQKERIVNWDPKGQTVISDDEIVYEERTSTMYTFKYHKDIPITIATTRPETKLGDTGIAVHPDDSRYAQYIGQTFTCNFAGADLTLRVVGDEAVDPEFGTGAVGVTPAHSMTDWEIAERHDLPMVQVINEYAKMTAGNDDILGTKTTVARDAVVTWLKEQDLLIDEEVISQNVSTAERTGGIIEPLPKMQWWIDTNKKITIPHSQIEGIDPDTEYTLKEVMMHVVRAGDISIVPDRFERVYYDWIEKLRPWNISRQIWYGHRVPVWYDENNTAHLPAEQEIVFMRHGQSEYNKKNLLQGQFNSPLTETGKEQIKVAAKELSDRYSFGAILCSDLDRSHDSAKIIQEHIDAPIHTLEDLREVDAGSHSGNEHDGDPLVQALTAGDGESLADVYERAQRVVEYLKNQLPSDKDILVVGHSTFTSVILAVWHGIPQEHIITKHENWTLENGNYESLINIHYPQGENLRQDEDTLDTWFSSGLWTLSTLGWPDASHDLMNFHPTNVLETGYDIIFFWVARMILMTTYLAGQVPFKTVYLHGIVRDENGKKISKSLGNNIDPLEYAEKYGTDAVRMALIIGTAPGQDSKVGENKIKAYKKFANKLWNITRFVLENTQDISRDPQYSYTQTDQTLHENLTILLKEISQEMSDYKYYLVGEKLYHYTWHTFADEILENSKVIFESGNDEDILSRKQLLINTLHKLITVLHPFMPYITEEIWQNLPDDHKENTHPLMVQRWPLS